MGKFPEFLTVICPQHINIFFPDNNLSKCQWIFSKLGICIAIVEIWLGIAYGQILSIRIVRPRHIHIFVSGH